MAVKNIRASIDIGSNSVLMLIGTASEAGVEVIDDYSHITSLGRDLDKTKMFHLESMSLTWNALTEYKDKSPNANTIVNLKLLLPLFITCNTMPAKKSRK